MPDWKRLIGERLDASGHDVDTDVVEELAQHAAGAWAAARADGLDADAAGVRVSGLIEGWLREASALKRQSSRLAFEPPPPEARPRVYTGLLQDARYAVRLFRRKPGFVAVVLVTMALGIAATTSLFNVTYGVLAKPLPWPEADRLVLLKETRGGHPARFGTFTNASYLAWREASTSVEAIGAWAPRFFTLTEAGDPERIRTMAASASLFEVLQVRPLIGTTFTEADETAGGVVLLGESLWRQRFGGDPGVLGRVVQLDGKAHRIVGVLPRQSGYPDPDVLAWVPFRVPPTTGNMLSLFDAVARLRPGVSAAQASAEGTARAQAAPRTADSGMVIRAVFGEDGEVQVSATPLREALTADVRQPLLILLAAVGLLFVAATGNVAGLQLAHATTRVRELAIRTALGANPSRVTRQLLVENVLLSVAGGTAGVALALLLDRALPSLLPTDFPRLQHLGIDRAATLFAVVVSILAGVVFGSVPVLRARRLNLIESLADDGRSPAGASSRTGVARGRVLIMAGQVAIACVLLIGAALLARSFDALVRADRGFDPANVLTARVQMPAFAYQPPRRAELTEAILERLRAVEGVTAATFSDGPPLGVFGGTAFMLDDRQAQAASRTVTAGYFAAMGMRIVAGRDFSDDDIASNRPVFIVNRTFARQYLRPDPVGQRVRGWVRKGRDHWEVIGVVDDVRHRGVTAPVEPEVYLYRERGDVRTYSSSPTFIVRSAGDPMRLASSLGAIVRQQDPLLTVDSVMTMEDRVMAGLARPRLYAILLAAFGALALLITGVGLLAVLSYVVAQRSRELAVRSALGATQGNIVRLVLRQGAAVCLGGLAIGLPAAWLLTGTMRGLLFGVERHDVLTFTLVPVVLFLVTLIACVPPAVRAVRLDPLRLLRSA
jgi:putative ABC transport system permease protein